MAARELVKRQILSMERELAILHELCTKVELRVPFLRLVQKNEIVQLRMRFDPDESNCFVLRQQPVIWLSYDWKDQNGVQSKLDSRERYIEFAWFGVKIRAHFMPVSHWKDRKFTFRFAETRTSIAFYSICTVADSIPSLPRSLYCKGELPTTYLPGTIKKHIAALRYTRHSMERLLQAFDQLADRYI